MNKKQLEAICQYLDSLKYVEDLPTASKDNQYMFHKCCRRVSGGDEGSNLSYREREAERNRLANSEDKDGSNLSYHAVDAERFGTDILSKNEWKNKSLSYVVKELELESGKTPPQIYNDAGLTRAVYGGIFNGKNKNPTKKTVLALSVGLHLDETKLIQFVNFCGYTIPTNFTDAIVLYFVHSEKNYAKYDINSKEYKEGNAIIDLNLLLQELKDIGKEVEILGSISRSL